MQFHDKGTDTFHMRLAFTCDLPEDTLKGHCTTFMEVLVACPAALRSAVSSVHTLSESESDVVLRSRRSGR